MSLKLMETLEKWVPHDCALSPIFSHFTSKKFQEHLSPSLPQRWENRNQKPERCQLHSMLSFSVSKAFESLPPILTSNLNCNRHGLLHCFSAPSHTEQKFLWIGIIVLIGNSTLVADFPLACLLKKLILTFFLRAIWSATIVHMPSLAQWFFKDIFIFLHYSILPAFFKLLKECKLGLHDPKIIDSTWVATDVWSWLSKPFN
jgi:hypothetical protein